MATVEQSILLQARNACAQFEYKRLGISEITYIHGEAAFILTLRNDSPLIGKEIVIEGEKLHIEFPRPQMGILEHKIVLTARCMPVRKKELRYQISGRVEQYPANGLADGLMKTLDWLVSYFETFNKLNDYLQS